MVPSDFVAVCPPVRDYSAAFNNEVARELEAQPASSSIRIMLRDYLELRDALRSCRDVNFAIGEHGA